MQMTWRVNKMSNVESVTERQSKRKERNQNYEKEKKSDRD